MDLQKLLKGEAVRVGDLTTLSTVYCDISAVCVNLLEGLEVIRRFSYEAVDLLI